MILMMDVSHYDARRVVNGKWVCDRPTDWQSALSKGIAVAAIKGSEGGRVLRAGRYVDGVVEDPALRVQWAAAAGRPRVYWHFFRSNVNAISQALDVIEIWQSLPVEKHDRIALDFETEDGMAGSVCLSAAASWMYEVERTVKLTPFLYTYPAFWIRVGGSRAAWAQRHPLWLAQWPLDNWVARLKLPPFVFSGERLEKLLEDILSGALVPLNGKPYNNALAPWGTEISMWQFSARVAAKEIPGHPAIKSVVDLNVIYKPWWSSSTPLPQPKHCPTCGQIIPSDRSVYVSE